MLHSLAHFGKPLPRCGRRLALAPLLVFALLAGCTTLDRWFDEEASVPVVPAGG